MALEAWVEWVSTPFLSGTKKNMHHTCTVQYVHATVWR